MTKNNEFTKLKLKAKFGVYYYKKITPSMDGDLDAPIYELYDANLNLIAVFPYYADMKYYCETGKRLD